MPSAKSDGAVNCGAVWGATWASVCLGAPLEFRKDRATSTMVRPFQCMTSRGASVTVATTVDSRFSASASARKASTSSGESTTAMRS